MQRMQSIPHILICLALIFGGTIDRSIAAPPAAETLDDGEHGMGGLIPPDAPQQPKAAPAQKVVQPRAIKPALANRPVARVVRPPTIARVFPPPATETRLRSGEILVTLTGAMPRAEIDAILRRHRLTEIEIAPIALLRTGVRLWRSVDSRNAGTLVTELGSETAIASAQPNYVYALQEDTPPPDAAKPAATLPQYALAKLNVPANVTAVAAQPGKPPGRILVAVIDTAIDDTHPDLGGVIEARFDAIGNTPTHTLSHGTAIAGAIAAHGQLQGVAPDVGILSARAFERDDISPSGTTLSILKSLDWAAGAKARIINMSFAGPADPLMSRGLVAAYARGVILIGAAGNAGHASPPLYPAADEQVIAVTATDADDRLYEKANTGAFIAVAAPGVDVLLPSPEGNYDLQSGTSVSAAFVSGVAARVLEQRSAIQPAEMRRLLTSTAHPLGTPDQHTLFGSGLIDAGRAMAQTLAGAN